MRAAGRLTFLRATRIVIAQLPTGIAEADLLALLQGDGRGVRTLRVERHTDPAHTYAFAEMVSLADAVHAVLALDGRVLPSGERLHVTEAAPRLVSRRTRR
jgi:hypothetical protein